VSRKTARTCESNVEAGPGNQISGTVSVDKTLRNTETPTRGRRVGLRVGKSTERWPNTPKGTRFTPQESVVPSLVA
jgi:hypothetical protein